MSDLPALPSNAAWTSDYGCNVTGGTVAQRTYCRASCSPGFIESGSMVFMCDPTRLVVYQGWDAGANNLTCTGKEGTRLAARLCPIHAVCIM
jgi:hypothetical protein